MFSHLIGVILKYILTTALTFQMALLPEGITELLHHEKLCVPLVCVVISYALRLLTFKSFPSFTTISYS